MNQVQELKQTITQLQVTIIQLKTKILKLECRQRLDNSLSPLAQSHKQKPITLYKYLEKIVSVEVPFHHTKIVEPERPVLNRIVQCRHSECQSEQMQEQKKRKHQQQQKIRQLQIEIVQLRRQNQEKITEINMLKQDVEKMSMFLEKQKFKQSYKMEENNRIIKGNTEVEVTVTHIKKQQNKLQNNKKAILKNNKINKI